VLVPFSFIKISIRLYRGKNSHRSKNVEDDHWNEKDKRRKENKQL
jgi:hypothetical protein